MLLSSRGLLKTHNYEKCEEIFTQIRIFSGEKKVTAKSASRKFSFCEKSIKSIKLEWNAGHAQSSPAAVRRSNKSRVARGTLRQHVLFAHVMSNSLRKLRLHCCMPRGLRISTRLTEAQQVVGVWALKELEFLFSIFDFVDKVKRREEEQRRNIQIYWEFSSPRKKVCLRFYFWFIKNQFGIPFYEFLATEFYAKMVFRIPRKRLSFQFLSDFDSR